MKKKKVPQKTQLVLRKGKKKCQLAFTTLVSLVTRRDGKSAPISAPSIFSYSLHEVRILRPNRFAVKILALFR